jgi:hypothetical protein
MEWLRALNQEGFKQTEGVECWTYKAKWFFKEKVLWWGRIIEVIIRWWDLSIEWENLGIRMLSEVVSRIIWNV